jgi:hypothetical protein
MIETSATIVALTGAILKVQGAVDSVKKDKVNPHFKNRYATLENVIDTARPALQEAGIAFVQAPGQVLDGSVEVTTMLVHESGEWMRSTLHVPLGKRDAQGVGSAITYGCRYSLMAMLGLPPTDDDDGAAASAPYKSQKSADHYEGYAPPPKKANGKPETGWRADGSRTSFWVKENGTADELRKQIQDDSVDCHTMLAFERLKEDCKAKARDLKLNRDYWTVMVEEFGYLERRIMDSLDNAQLAEMPLKDTLQKSLRRPAEDEAAMLDQRMRDERAALANHPIRAG